MCRPQDDPPLETFIVSYMTTLFTTAWSSTPMLIRQFWDEKSVVLGFTGRECDVLPFNGTYQSTKGVPIVTGATA
jgi:hypothetical protein